MQALPPSIDQLIGVTVGNYVLEQLLVQGQVNAVYRARQKSSQATDQTVMLTLFTTPTDFGPQARYLFNERFKREAEALVRLHHPNILPVHDFGEQFGYPYMVTPSIKGATLSQVVRRQGNFTPELALAVIKQIAVGLDFAHSHGVIHGSLKSANILLDLNQTAQIAGFGLVRILQVQGIMAINHPYAHLISTAGSFLGAPEYIAPELVQGSPFDAQSDLYALGMILFELLSGKLPFTGPDPFAVAHQHVLQPVPSLQTYQPDMPPAIDLVVQRALEHDPAQRFSSSERLVSALERVLRVLRGDVGKGAPPSDATLPPTVNWFEEEIASKVGLAGSPTFAERRTPGQIPAVGMAPQGDAGGWQFRPPIVTNQMAAIKAGAAKNSASADENLVDPFTWWSTEVLTREEDHRSGGTFQARKTGGHASVKKPQPARKSRRRAVALIATGGVVAAGVLGVGGISLAHVFLQAKQNSQVHNGGQPTNTATTPQTTTKQGTTATPQATKQASATKATTPTTGTTPAASPTTAPTAPPTPKPTHTGTVIGSTNQQTGTAKAFTNPGDGEASLLVHAPNGNFAAVEITCPHEGAPVRYDAAHNRFSCTKHTAFFTLNGAVISGPPKRPLTTVAVRVNNDGTVTTG